MATKRIPTIRGSEIDKDEALYDGIRPWMRNSIRAWLDDNLTYEYGNSTRYYKNAITDIELQGRINLGPQKYDSWRYDALIKVFLADPNHGLDIVQAYVETADATDETHILKSHRLSPKEIDKLNSLLIKGGSKWHVVIDGRKASIQARVDEVTENAYKRLSASSDDYADLLKKAWSYCYGREPQPSEAYTYAVKAVEAVAWKRITPKNNTTTLGILLKDLEAKYKAGKVATVFKDKKAGTSVEMIIQNMKRLWEGHSDRHATGAYIEPTQLEAEVAVHLGIILCQLFSNETLAVS